MSPKQNAVIRFLRENHELTLNQAVDLIGKDVYANARFHVGNVLSNMVKRKMIIRVKPGLFALPKETMNFRLE